MSSIRIIIREKRDAICLNKIGEWHGHPGLA
jgi:hypothetical protein